MGRFRIQLLLEDNTWSTQYTIPKSDQYSDSPTDSKLLSLNFTTQNYGIKLIYDQSDTTHADMSFSNITITHSVYSLNNVNCFRDLFESIPDYRKIVLLIYLIKDHKNIFREIGFSERNVNYLNSEFKKKFKRTE